MKGLVCIWILILFFCASVLLVACKKSPDSSADFDLNSSYSGIKQVSAFSLEHKRPIEAKRLISPVSAYSKFYPCNKYCQTMDVDNLNIEEKMLVFGYELLDNNDEPFDPPKIFNPLSMLSNMIIKYYVVHGTMPKTSDDLFGCFYLCSNEMFVKSGKTKEDARNEFDKSITSPVTGEPIIWDNMEFSAGNAFVTVMNDNKEAFAYAKESFVKMFDTYPELQRPMDEGLTIFLYYRVYGTDGVIDNVLMAPYWTDDQLENMRKS